MVLKLCIFILKVDYFLTLVTHCIAVRPVLHLSSISLSEMSLLVSKPLQCLVACLDFPDHAVRMPCTTCFNFLFSAKINDLIGKLFKFQITALVVLNVLMADVAMSAPVKCTLTRRVALKQFLPRLGNESWILIERDQGNVQQPSLRPPHSQRRKRNAVVTRPSDVPSTFCPWRWEHDFDRNREPQYLKKAVCNNCNSSNCKKVDFTHRVFVKSCDKISTKGQLINLWKKTTVILPVAFYYKTSS